MSQSTNGGASIHNNINVAINYTVHQGTTVAPSKDNTPKLKGNKNTKTRSKKRQRRSADGKNERDLLLQSSFSKLLDQHLLMNTNQPP